MTKVRRKVVKRVDSRAITLGWEKKEECEIKNMLASNGKKNNDNTNPAHRREPTFVWRMSRFSRQAKLVVGARPLKLGFSTHDNRPLLLSRVAPSNSKTPFPRGIQPLGAAPCFYPSYHCLFSPGFNQVPPVGPYALLVRRICFWSVHACKTCNMQSPFKRCSGSVNGPVWASFISHLFSSTCNGTS